MDITSVIIHCPIMNLIVFSLISCCFLAAGSAVAAVPDDHHVYLVMVEGPPVVHLTSPYDDQQLLHDHDTMIYMPGQSPHDYAAYLTNQHDFLLQHTFASGTYQKIYSYNHLVNGFAVLLSEKQAEKLRSLPEVVHVERDYGVQKQTTYTPTYLGLPNGAWDHDGGPINAGEGVVIGIVDTGIDPTHPSFSDNTLKPYPNVTHYKGSCEVATEFPTGSCNKKLIGAQHFAAAAIAGGVFNASIDFASPLDADGHGTHTASTAAGNNVVPVIVDGLNFGFASGMAPRAHIAMYKALYRGIGGFMADVVAAIEQAVKDKVDILSLSIGPTGIPSGIATYFNIFDMAMLAATKAGVFVVQAAGNAGPSPQTILSFSPWICSVAASVHDRTYENSLILGNNITIKGIGLASGTSGNGMYKMILAKDGLKDGNATDYSECQNATLFDKSLVQGKVLICSYSINFLFGGSSVRKVAQTVKDLSAAGVVMVIEPDLDGPYNFGAIPFSIPAIIISKFNDSQTVLNYYSSAPNFTATTRILGGANATFSNEAPKVASFSSRGPDTANDALAAAEVLKPSIMAPGNMIWAAWSSIGVDSTDFLGQRFAMISGTSMATPHIAGIAALVKQKNPQLSPAALASALATTAITKDKNGNPLLAISPSSNNSIPLGPATPFDYGAGSVNATAALDPGLVFDAGFEDYVNFLCTTPGASAMVKNTTGMSCNTSPGMPTDLNLPSITIANLTSTRTIKRTLTNIASLSEMYTITITKPKGTSISINPTSFTIDNNSSQSLTITMSPIITSQDPSFGSILLSGSKGHSTLLPISVISTLKSTELAESIY